MQEFEQLISKHGETGVQAFVEMWERNNNIRHQDCIPLEDRWLFFVSKTEVYVALDAVA